MAITKPEVEWLFEHANGRRLGLLNLAGKWAVVRGMVYHIDDQFTLVTDWLDSREAAIGFLKLIKE